MDYYYNGGYYYRWNNRGIFELTIAPFGVRLSVLPAGCRVIYYSNIPYYYYGGTYYNYIDSYYEVVNPPVGAVVEYISPDCETVYINGETYYIGSGVQYKPVIINGQIWYRIIKLV